MELVIKQLIKNYGGNAKSINDGYCLNFAKDIQRLFPKAEIYIDGEPDLELNSFYHAYIKYENKYYDSETPNGVNDWRDLPIYSRCSMFDFDVVRLGLKDINIPYMEKNYESNNDLSFCK